jgi:hypothetical protein
VKSNFPDPPSKQLPVTVRNHPCHPSIPWKRTAIVAVLLSAISVSGSIAFAQESEAPFTVLNPKHKKWPVDEAQRIYFAACERVAQAIRPEKPPRLLPKFALVLGANANEMVRDGSSAAIHLKQWDSRAFTEAVVILASREILNSAELSSISREVLVSAQATVSVGDLRRGQ